MSRSELALLAIVLVAGIGLRMLALSHAAIEHFDEGVYASNHWFGEVDGQYPFQHLYAPPLLPTLIEWSITFFGSGHWGTLAVNLFAGCATVLLVWWVGRCWYGPAAGLAAGTLAALSDFHILYSRTALTDPMLSFWMLAAVYLIWEAVRRPCIGWALLASMAAALAWWTKYNGWLTLAVGIAGVIPWLLFHRSEKISIGKSLGILCLIAGVAFALWSPVLYGLSDHGGYAAVQENHRGYFVGPNGWLDSLKQQVAAQRYFDGWLSCTGIGIAFLVGFLLDCFQKARFTWNIFSLKLAFSFFFVAWLIALSAWPGSSLELGFLAVLGMAAVLRSTKQSRHNQQETSGRALACWLNAAWFFGLLVGTPLYRAYPRLTLPWLVCTWLAAGAFFGFVIDRLHARMNSSSPREDPRFWGIGAPTGAVSAIVLIAVAILTPWFQSGIVGWQDRTGLESIAERVVSDSAVAPNSEPYDQKRIFYVYGEPALFFNLRALGGSAAPIADLGFAAPNVARMKIPTFLVAGPHATRSQVFNDQLAKYEDRFELISTYPYRPSDLVLLNGHHASELAESGFDPVEQIYLYRLK